VGLFFVGCNDGGSGGMELVSVALPGLIRRCTLPTAGAVGCILVAASRLVSYGVRKRD
jgi:hypothetical protein